MLISICNCFGLINLLEVVIIIYITLKIGITLNKFFNSVESGKASE